MIFFKKKKKKEEPEPPASAPTPAPKKEKVAVKKERSLQEIAHERVLTAEGWRRQMLLQLSKQKKA
ncbi:MAG TPA: hypothetical protein VJK48_04790 [Chlamydiales bacterium]|nr:hypothetical protein [Chlamydiales bacterium]